MSTLIKNVEVCDKSSSFHGKKVHILIENGRIVSISSNETKAEREFDGNNCKVSSGWFALRVSLGDPGFEHKETLESGTKAALKGGFTNVFLMPTTKPIVQTKDTISYILSKSASYVCNVYPMAAATVDLKGEEMAEILDLHHAGAVAFTDGAQPLSHAGLLTKLLQYLQPIDGLLLQHAEEKKLTQYGQMNEGITSTYLGLKGMPHIAEEIVILRDIELLEYIGGRIHFSHISSAKSVDIIRNAKKKGLKVTCDVSIPHLVFDDSVLNTFDTNYKINPPLRTKHDVEALWKGVADGTIDAIGIDHEPQDTESKQLEFDQAEFGMIQLETAFAALNTHKPQYIDSELIVEKLLASANLFNVISPKIEVGENANLTMFSTDEAWSVDEENILSKSKNTPFLGQTLRGKVKAVFNKNTLVTF